MNKIERKHKVIGRIKPRKVTYLVAPFKKWVKLDNGEIIKAYNDDKMKEPKEIVGNVIATANTKKELM